MSSSRTRFVKKANAGSSRTLSSARNLSTASSVLSSTSARVAPEIERHRHSRLSQSQQPVPPSVLNNPIRVAPEIQRHRHSGLSQFQQPVPPSVLNDPIRVAPEIQRDPQSIRGFSQSRHIPPRGMADHSKLDSRRFASEIGRHKQELSVTSDPIEIPSESQNRTHDTLSNATKKQDRSISEHHRPYTLKETAASRLRVEPTAPEFFDGPVSKEKLAFPAFKYPHYGTMASLQDTEARIKNWFAPIHDFISEPSSQTQFVDQDHPLIHFNQAILAVSNIIATKSTSKIHIFHSLFKMITLVQNIMEHRKTTVMPEFHATMQTPNSDALKMIPEAFSFSTLKILVDKHAFHFVGRASHDPSKTLVSFFQEFSESGSSLSSESPLQGATAAPSPLGSESPLQGATADPSPLGEAPFPLSLEDIQRFIDPLYCDQFMYLCDIPHLSYSALSALAKVWRENLTLIPAVKHSTDNQFNNDLRLEHMILHILQRGQKPDQPFELDKSLGHYGEIYMDSVSNLSSVEVIMVLQHVLMNLSYKCLELIEVPNNISEITGNEETSLPPQSVGLMFLICLLSDVLHAHISLSLYSCERMYELVSGSQNSATYMHALYFSGVILTQLRQLELAREAVAYLNKCKASLAHEEQPMDKGTPTEVAQYVLADQLTFYFTDCFEQCMQHAALSPETAQAQGSSFKFMSLAEHMQNHLLFKHQHASDSSRLSTNPQSQESFDQSMSLQLNEAGSQEHDPDNLQEQQQKALAEIKQILEKLLADISLSENDTSEKLEKNAEKFHNNVQSVKKVKKSLEDIKKLNNDNSEVIDTINDLEETADNLLSLLEDLQKASKKPIHVNQDESSQSTETEEEEGNLSLRDKPEEEGNLSLRDKPEEEGNLSLRDKPEEEGNLSLPDESDEEVRIILTSQQSKEEPISPNQEASGLKHIMTLEGAGVAEEEPEFAETFATNEEPEFAETFATNEEPEFAETFATDEEPEFAETFATDEEPEFAETFATDEEPEFAETFATDEESEFEGTFDPYEESEFEGPFTTHKEPEFEGTFTEHEESEFEGTLFEGTFTAHEEPDALKNVASLDKEIDGSHLRNDHMVTESQGQNIEEVLVTLHELQEDFHIFNQCAQQASDSPLMQDLRLTLKQLISVPNVRKGRFDELIVKITEILENLNLQFQVTHPQLTAEQEECNRLAESENIEQYESWEDLPLRQTQHGIDRLLHILNIKYTPTAQNHRALIAGRVEHQTNSDEHDKEECDWAIRYLNNAIRKPQGYCAALQGALSGFLEHCQRCSQELQNIKKIYNTDDTKLSKVEDLHVSTASIEKVAQPTVVKPETKQRLLMATKDMLDLTMRKIFQQIFEEQLPLWKKSIPSNNGMDDQENDNLSSETQNNLSPRPVDGLTYYYDQRQSHVRDQLEAELDQMQRSISQMYDKILTEDDCVRLQNQIDTAFTDIRQSCLHKMCNPFFKEWLQANTYKIQKMNKFTHEFNNLKKEYVTLQNRTQALISSPAGHNLNVILEQLEQNSTIDQDDFEKLIIIIQDALVYLDSQDQNIDLENQEEEDWDIAFSRQEKIKKLWAMARPQDATKHVSQFAELFKNLSYIDANRNEHIHRTTPQFDPSGQCSMPCSLAMIYLKEEIHNYQGLYSDLKVSLLGFLNYCRRCVDEPVDDINPEDSSDSMDDHMKDSDAITAVASHTDEPIDFKIRLKQSLQEVVNLTPETMFERVFLTQLKLMQPQNTDDPENENFSLEDPEELPLPTLDQAMRYYREDEQTSVRDGLKERINQTKREILSMQDNITDEPQCENFQKYINSLMLKIYEYCNSTICDPFFKTHAENKRHTLEEEF